MNKKDLDIQKIAKFLNGKMSLEEIADFKEKLKKEENKHLVEQFIITNHLIDVDKQRFDSEQAFERFILSKQEKPKNIKVFFLKKGRSLLKYAALLLGPIILLYLYNSYNLSSSMITNESNAITIKLSDGSVNVINENDSQTIVDSKTGNVVGVQNKSQLLYNSSVNNLKNITSEVAINVVTVPRGKRFEVVLSDGTHINLNSETIIKYPVEFKQGEDRMVELIGEAYFKVAKDKEHPFIVKTKEVRTQVLGTEFNVTAYNNDAFSKVVLIEGSVLVSAEGDESKNRGGILLKPGKKIVYSKIEKLMKESDAVVMNHVAWINGVLLFENESFMNISKKLERFYNVDIINNYEAFNNENFTGQFDVETIEEVFKTFKKSTSFEYIIENNKVNINPLKLMKEEK